MYKHIYIYIYISFLITPRKARVTIKSRNIINMCIRMCLITYMAPERVGENGLT